MKRIDVSLRDSHAEYAKQNRINFSKYLQTCIERDIYNDRRKKEQEKLIEEISKIAEKSTITYSDIGCLKINNVLFQNKYGNADNSIYILYVRENDDIIPDVARALEEVAIFTAEELNIYKHDTKDDIARTIRAKRHKLYRDSKGNFYVLSIIK